MLLDRIRSPGWRRKPNRIQNRLATHEFVVNAGRAQRLLHELREFFGVGQVLENKRYDNHREHLYRYVVRRRQDCWRR